MRVFFGTRIPSKHGFLANACVHGSAVLYLDLMHLTKVEVCIVRVPARDYADLTCFYSWLVQGLQITDLPLAIIDLIAKHVVQDRDSVLRTDQVSGQSVPQSMLQCLLPTTAACLNLLEFVALLLQAVAADLMNLSHTCRTLNAADVRGTLWRHFEDTCPPVPACPLDNDFEVMDDYSGWRQLTLQPSKPGRPGLRSAVTKAQKSAATWEEVSQCLDQDASMFSKDALIALLSTLGVGVTLYGGMHGLITCLIIITQPASPMHFFDIT